MEHFKTYPVIHDKIKKIMLVSEYPSESEYITSFMASQQERLFLHKQTGKYFINSFFPSFPSKSWNRVVKGFSAIATQNKRVPLQSDVVVTGRCHCKCWHCFRIKDEQMDLPVNQVKKTISSLQSMGTATVGITGGEPMLHPDIREIISCIPENMEGQLYTTGHRIDEDFVNFIQKTHVTRVIISLDHYNPAIAADMRSYKDAHSEAIHAIRLLVKAGIFTAVTVCVTEDLLKEGALEKYFSFVSSLKPNEIRVVMPIPQGNIEGIDVRKIYVKATHFVRRLKRDYAKDNNFTNIINFCELESASYLGCGAGANYVSINNDGAVTPCVAVPLSFGNVFDDDLESVFYDMGEYFVKSGCVCYGKILGKALNDENISTEVTPLPEDISIKLAEKCKGFTKGSAFFDNYLNWR